MGGAIFILSGAGLSAESGLKTFRADDGLWEDHRVEDVATPKAFERNPDLVHRFYNARRVQAAKAQPNVAHLALAQLQNDYDAPVHLITQNVDDLLERAGCNDVTHMHGALSGALCGNCGARWAAPLEMRTPDLCPTCSSPATRPDIGKVYPAAGFSQLARELGIETLEINLHTSIGLFDSVIEGPATQTIPEWVASVL